MLGNVVDLFFNFIYIHVVIKVIVDFAGIEKRFKERIKYTIIFGVITPLIFIALGYLGVLIVILGVYLYYYKYCKLGVKSSLKNLLKVCFVMFVSGFGSVLVSKNIYYRELPDLDRSMLANINSNVIMIVLTLIISNIFGIKKHFRIDTSRKKFIYLHIAYMIAMLSIIIIQVYVYKHNRIENLDVVSTVFTLTVLIYLFMNIGFMKLGKMFGVERDERLKREIELERMKVYTDIIENLIDDQRRFRHDFKNMMLPINSYIEENDMESLKSYLKNELMLENKKIDMEVLYCLKHIKDTALKGIISSKVTTMVNMGIDVNVNIIEDIEEACMDTIEMARVIGIIIDNAMEAAIESKKKSVSISVLDDGDEISIIVDNSIDYKPDISKIFENGYSTKGAGRGLGLATVRDIINKVNTCVKLNTLILEERFLQEVCIKKAPCDRSERSLTS